MREFESIVNANFTRRETRAIRCRALADPRMWTSSRVQFLLRAAVLATAVIFLLLTVLAVVGSAVYHLLVVLHVVSA